MSASGLLLERDLQRQIKNEALTFPQLEAQGETCGEATVRRGAEDLLDSYASMGGFMLMTNVCRLSRLFE